MADSGESTSDRKVLKLSIMVIVLIIAVLGAVSWLLTRGVENNRYNEPGTRDSSNTQPAGPTPAEPANPNVTGGSSGAGTGNSNDPGTVTPSPAGGIDTNQVPAGGSSNP